MQERNTEYQNIIDSIEQLIIFDSYEFQIQPVLVFLREIVETLGSSGKPTKDHLETILQRHLASAAVQNLWELEDLKAE